MSRIAQYFTRRFRSIRLSPTTLIVIAVVSCAAITVSARAWFIKSRQDDGRQIAAPPVSSQRLEAEPITLTPQGFEPAEITRPKGSFLLVVNDRTGQRLIEWRLERQGGNRLRSVSMPMGKHKWREVVDLPPGNYLLSEAGNPQWECQITITDQ